MIFRCAHQIIDCIARICLRQSFPSGAQMLCALFCFCGYHVQSGWYFDLFLKLATKRRAFSAEGGSSAISPRNGLSEPGRAKTRVVTEWVCCRLTAAWIGILLGHSLVDDPSCTTIVCCNQGKQPAVQHDMVCMSRKAHSFHNTITTPSINCKSVAWDLPAWRPDNLA